jgi:hypothetical protein
MDACTTGEHCDTAVAMCEFSPLDSDGDGYAPKSCGGTDCNDAARNIHPGEAEACNGTDDDCDGTVDNDATCPVKGQVCTKGACACADGTTMCGGTGPGGAIGASCADLQTDPSHCGGCRTDCGPAGACAGGKCSCPSPGTMCGDSCVDTDTSHANCGGCDKACSNTQACVAGKCEACGGKDQPCCSGFLSCSDGLTCSGTPGTAGATCACASPSKMCGQTCTDVTLDPDNCGSCDNKCAQGQLCINTGTTSSCGTCSQAGDPCCSYNGTTARTSA